VIQLNSILTKDSGNKAQKLSQLFQNGYLVPDGFVFDNSYFLKFLELNDLMQKVDLLKSVLFSIKFEHLERLSNEIIKCIMKGKLFLKYESELEICFNYLKKTSKDSLICRSSGLAEDSLEHSFAGVYDSILDIKNIETLKSAVKKCYASVFSTKALKYVISNKIKNYDFGLALIIQSMIKAEISGVMFIVKDNNSWQLYIDVVEGRCENIVSNNIIPETHEIKDIYKDNSMWVNQISILKPKQKESLIETAKKLSLNEANNLDVEFCFSKCMIEPFILQCRPITKKLEIKKEAFRQNNFIYKGTVCSNGVVRAQAIYYEPTKIAMNECENRIVIVESLNMKNYELIYFAKGVISEKMGSKLSHISIACREIGIPYLSGIPNLYSNRKFKNKELILDCNQGCFFEIDIQEQKKSEMNNDAITPENTLIINNFFTINYLMYPTVSKISYEGLEFLILDSLFLCDTIDEFKIYLDQISKELILNKSKITLSVDYPDFTEEELLIIKKKYGNFRCSELKAIFDEIILKTL
jgi:pyruvate,water dikinase